MLASIISYFLRNFAGRICPSLRHSVCCVPFDSQRQPWSTSSKPSTQNRVHCEPETTSWSRSVIYKVRCESNAQSIPALPSRPPPPPGYCGVFAGLVSPGGGAFVLRRPGAGHLLPPGPVPRLWHARGFLSEYNYTKGFTGKKVDWLICPGQN